MYFVSSILAALAVQLSLASPIQPRAIPPGAALKLTRVAQLTAAPAAALEKRALPTCNHDNLYRLFLDKRYSSSASEFCSVYIESTATVFATTSPVAATVTSVVTVTDTTTSTDLITVTPPAMKKRQAATPTAPDNAATYPPSRLSSACSCLVTPSTVTKTITETSPVTTIVDVTTTIDVTAAGPTETSFAPAAYCSGVNVGAYTGLGYYAQCGVSYTSLSDGMFVTAATYTDCLNYCDNNGDCGYFSFLLTTTVQNCFIALNYDDVNGYNFEQSTPDNTVNSGAFVYDNSS